MADLSLIKFCISNDLECFGVDEAKLKIKKKGGIIRETVTNDVWYYITNHPESENEEATRAKKLGVTFLTENEFVKMLE